MNRKMKFSLICLLFIILASNSFAEVDLTDLVENIYPAVVTVIAFDKDKKPLNQGSGFFIDANGHLITNYHVLEGTYHTVAKTYDGKKYPIKSVIDENKEMDLIKVLVDIPRSSVQWIEATGAWPSIAERVVVVGSPMGLEQSVSEGIVSSIREIPDLGKIFQISAAISPGSSGGPVVNMKGQVIGIVSFYLIKGQNLNFAIPAKYLLDLKPSKTIKTISEWTYRVDRKTLRKKPRKSRLFVQTEAENTRIRILNIKPKFYQGIILIPERYHIEVSADGYEMKKFWIKIEPGEDKNLEIPLKKLPHMLTKDPHTLFLLGSDYYKKGENKKAVEAYKQVIRINPDNADAHFFLGLTYAKLNLYRKAIEAYKQVIRINPDYAEAHHDLGITYNILGLHREAIEAYKQAIRIFPDYATAHQFLGFTYAKIGLHKKAVEAYKQAIRINPDNAKAHHLLGIAYIDLGLYREAVEAYKQAIRINPDNAKAHRDLGFTYSMLGLQREAVEAYKQAIRINPDNAKAHHLLGIAYIDLGHRGDALEQYKILKSLDKEKANMLFDVIYR